MTLATIVTEVTVETLVPLVTIMTVFTIGTVMKEKNTRLMIFWGKTKVCEKYCY